MFGFGKKKKQPVNKFDFEIAFHKDANGHTEHGSILASNRGLGLSNETVRFSFIGMYEPPLLDRDIMNYIWDRAEAQGYEPKQLRSYATRFAPLRRLHQHDAPVPDNVTPIAGGR